MKRTVFLCFLCVLFSMMAACGGAAPVEITLPPTVTATEASEDIPAAMPAIEPALSPEEILYHSLPERMKQAVDTGIVELSQLEDLNRIVTVGEASQMLQKAYIHRTCMESKTFHEIIHREEFASRTANRGIISMLPGLADMELTHGSHYKDYEQWIQYQSKSTRNNEDLWSFSWRLGLTCPVIGDMDKRGNYSYKESGMSIFSDPFNSTLNAAPDYGAYETQIIEDPMFGKDSPYPTMSSYACKIYDSTTGKKFMEFEDGMFHAEREMTVFEMADCALCYYHYPNPMKEIVYITAEDRTVFNPEIITEELLSKETDLPAVSNAFLPADWHGVVMDDMELRLIYDDAHLDNEIYEYEIQTIKEAGFNYIGLILDFNWLQESIVNFSNQTAFQNVCDEKNSGKVSLERLEKLDQVLAWCMKYDIHLNIRATGIGGFTCKNVLTKECGYTDRFLKDFVSTWQIIARRYADIPNKYLSVTPITPAMSSELDKVKQKLVTESIAAIQEISPDRCIIADIFSENMKAETFAKMGVALSFHMRAPGKILDHNDYYESSSRIWSATITKQGKSVVENFSWPYNGDVDAKKLLTLKHEDMQSFEQVAAVAQEYGVGFMLGDFGVNHQTRNMRPCCSTVFSRSRYADEPYFAMITDITGAMEELGCGWCFSHWYGPCGAAFCLPANQTSTYEQIEDYPYYIDQGMFHLFRTINGVN